MKNTSLFLCLASLLGGSVAFAQTVSTDPVGFINITVQGGTLSHPTTNLISPTLTNPIAFQGTIASISSTAPYVISITGASFSGNQFNSPNGTYYAEVFSATNPGALSDITATGASSVTTVDNLSSFASVGDSVRIRQHVTINQFLGASNTYGLLGSDDSSTADSVLVYSGDAQTTYWYYTGTPGAMPSDAGWYDLNGTSAGSVTIAPSEGVLIQRKGTGNVTITSTGTVKTGNTLFPIVHGFNFLGTLSAQGLTLASSGLQTSGLVGSGDSSTSDLVLVFSGGNQTTYWYYTGTAGAVPSDAGWYDLNGTSAASVSLAPGAAFIVNRVQGGALNWTLPAPTSF
jgi:hypothetical protein